MNIRQTLIIAIGCTSFVLSGCAENIRPYYPKMVGTEAVYSKNYQIGRSQTAYVGTTIVKVQDYRVVTRSTDVMSPNADFILEGGLLRTHGSEGDEYAVIGYKEVDGVDYQALDISNDTNHLLLVSSSGTIYPKLLGRIPGARSYTFVPYRTISPPDLRFTSSPERSADTHSGYVNYELIYSGRDDSSLYLTYREYTPDDLARAPFFQNLTYSSDARLIRFRDTQIKVEAATNESITYTVLSDGHPR